MWLCIMCRAQVCGVWYVCDMDVACVDVACIVLYVCGDCGMCWVFGIACIYVWCVMCAWHDVCCVWFSMCVVFVV